ncbi:Conserved_hypothetical protein [Hexamita inflata]|uniref:Uncharacterized protein n=1 Tax=Hexamita inflata TaxID=28002 RepID=A0AA86RFI4_9EUKA|nr:Conserved hypothetical protein [Hexamita inflata]
MLFIYVQLISDPCELMLRDYIWNLTSTCILSSARSPTAANIDVINVVGVQQLMFMQPAATGTFTKYCKYSGVNVDADISNLVFVLNLTLDVTGCDYVEFALFDQVQGNLNNVTITGTLKLANATTDTDLMLSKFVGEISSTVTNCSSNLQIQVLTTNYTVLSPQFISSFANVSFSLSQFFVQTNQLQISSRAVKLIDQTIILWYNQLLDDFQYFVYYDSRLKVQKFNEFYLAQDCYISNGAYICPYEDSVAVFSLVNNQVQERYCDHEFYNKEQDACTSSASAITLNNVVVSACPTGYVQHENKCLAFCPDGSQLVGSSCQACSQFTLQNLTCVDSCANKFQIDKTCYDYCPPGYYLENQVCVPIDVCTASYYDRCRDKCTTNTLVSYFECEFSCPNIIQIQHDQLCVAQQPPNSVSYTNSQSAQVVSQACRLGFYNYTDLCQLTCPELYEANDYARQCLLCPDKWDRTTRTCVASCTNGFGGNNTICESQADTTYCPVYYVLNSIMYCAKTCPPSLPYVSLQNRQVCVSQCQELEGAVSGLCQLCPANWDRQTQDCASSCSYYNNTICEQLGSLCPKFSVIGGKNICKLSCQLVSQSNAQMCVESCPSGYQFYENNMCKSQCSSAYFSFDSTNQIYICSSSCAKVYGTNSLLSTKLYCADSCSSMDAQYQYLLNQNQCVSSCPTAQRFVDAQNNCSSTCSGFVSNDGLSCLATCMGSQVYVDSFGMKYCSQCAQMNQIIYTASSQVTQVVCASSCNSSENQLDQICSLISCYQLSVQLGVDKKYNQNGSCQSACSEGYVSSSYVCVPCPSRQFFDRTTTTCVSQCQSINVSTISGFTFSFCETLGSVYCKFVDSSSCVASCDGFVNGYFCVEECPSKYSLGSGVPTCDASGSYQEISTDVICQQQEKDNIWTYESDCKIQADIQNRVVNILNFKTNMFYDQKLLKCKSNAILNTSEILVENSVFVLNVTVNLSSCNYAEISLFDELHVSSMSNVTFTGTINIINAPMDVDLYQVARNLSGTNSNSNANIKVYVSSTSSRNTTQKTFQTIAKIFSDQLNIQYQPTNLNTKEYQFSSNSQALSITIDSSLSSQLAILTYEQSYNIFQRTLSLFQNHYAQRTKIWNQSSFSMFSNAGVHVLQAGDHYINDTGCTALQYFNTTINQCIDSCSSQLSLFKICVDKCPKGFVKYGTACQIMCPPQYVNISGVCQVCSQFSDNYLCVSTCPYVKLGQACLRQCPTGYSPDANKLCVKSTCSMMSILNSSEVAYCVLSCPKGYYVGLDATKCVGSCGSYRNSTHCLQGCSGYEVYDNTNSDLDYVCSSSCGNGYLNHDGLCVSSVLQCSENQIPFQLQRICLACSGDSPYYDRASKACVATCAYVNGSNSMCEQYPSLTCLNLYQLGSFIQNAQAQCKNACQYSYVYNSKTFCLDSCSDVDSIKLFQSSTYSSTCATSCSSKKFQYNGQTRVCVDACHQFYENIVISGQVYQNCMDSCQNSQVGNSFFSTYSSQCVPYCAQSDTNDRCVSQKEICEHCPLCSGCSSIIDQCLDKIVSGTTSYSIYEIESEINSSQCIGLCPEHLPLLNAGKICVYDCAALMPFVENGTCKATCSTSKFKYVKDKVPICVQTCSQYYELVGSQQRCRAQCQSDEFGSVNVYRYNSQCVLSCSLTASIYHYDDKVCVQSCTEKIFDNATKQCLHSTSECGQFLVKDGLNTLCVSSCSSYFVSQSDGKWCVSACPSNASYLDGIQCKESCQFYKNVSNSFVCVSDCASFLFSYVNSSTILCTNLCPDSYGFGSQCLQQCPQQYFADKVTMKCVSSVNLCTNALYFAIGSSYFCLNQSTCPTTYPYLVNSQCLTSCPGLVPYMYLNTCLDKCSTGTYLVQSTFQCVDSCPIAQKYIDGTTCKSQCSLYYSQSGSVYTCQSSCPQVIYQQLCISACPVNFKYINGKQCVSSCPSKQYYEDTLKCETGTTGLCAFIQDDGNSQFICKPSCPVYIQGRQCVTQCNSSNKFINGQTCVAKCSSVSFGSQCLDYCPTNANYLQLDNTCGTSCRFYTQATNQFVCQEVPCLNNYQEVVINNQVTSLCTNCPVYSSAKLCVSSCQDPRPFVMLDKTCSSSAPYYVTQDNGTLTEVLSCSFYYEYNNSMIHCISNCTKALYGKLCQDTCPSGFILIDQVCIDSALVPPKCLVYVQNGVCVNQCDSGYTLSGVVCYKQCSQSCCTRQQIRANGICIAFANQLHIVTPDGEKIEISECFGVVLAFNQCMIPMCPAEQLWISDNCYPADQCDLQTWEGICTTKCAVGQFFNRTTKACMSSCVYQNRTVCEDPTNQTLCPFYTQTSSTPTYNCQFECPSMKQGRQCYDVCPSGTINVTTTECDLNCLLFLNGSCVSACPPNSVQIQYVCHYFGKLQCGFDQLLDLTGTCVDISNQIVQVLPDSSILEVNCVDGMLVNNKCVMKCPLDLVWIERNCYPKSECANIQNVNHRYVCDTDSQTNDIEDQTISSKC